MPTWDVSIYNMNYLITDTPIWLTTPRGPSLELTLTYNNREANGARHDIDEVQFYPFGFRWSSAYDGNYAYDPGSNVLVHLPNGMEVQFNEVTNNIYAPAQPRYDRHFSLTVQSNGLFRLDLKYGLRKYYFAALDDPDLQQTLIRVEDRYGDGVDIHRDVAGRITNVISDVTGASLNYLYNGDGNVTNVYEFDGAGQTTGRHATFEYQSSLLDNNAELVAITDMGGYPTTFDYGWQSYIPIAKDREGLQNPVPSNHHIESYTWPNNGEWTFDLRMITLAEYSFEPLRLRIADPESTSIRTNRFEYFYYAFANKGPVGVEDRNGNRRMYGLDRLGLSGPIATTFIEMLGDQQVGVGANRQTYDLGKYFHYQNHSVTAPYEITEEKLLTEGEVGRLGEYYGGGPDVGSPFEQPVWYCGTKTERIPRHRVAYVYHSPTNIPSGHRLITMAHTIHETGLGGADDQWSEVVEQDEYFDVVRIEDRKGDIVHFDRNFDRNVWRIRIHPDGGQEKTVYQAAFNDHGQVTAYTTDEGLQNTVSNLYAETGVLKGLLVRTEFPDGTSESYAYDPSTLFLAAVTNRLGLVYRVESDDMARPTEYTWPDLSQTTLGYSCCLPDSITDRFGTTTTIQYDGNKRPWLMQVEEMTNAPMVQLDYLPDGQISGIGVGSQLTNLATRTYGYEHRDGFSRPQSVTTPLGKTVASWSTDFLGFPVSLTNGEGVVTTFAWLEEKGQLLSASNATLWTEYAYDDDDLLLSIHKSSDTLGEFWTEDYLQDERSRVVAVTNRIANLPGLASTFEYVVSYGYSDRGLLDWSALSCAGLSGTCVTNDYTWHPHWPRLEGVSNRWASSSWEFDAYERPWIRTAGGVSEVRGYNALNRLEYIEMSSSTATVYTACYTYDRDRLSGMSNAVDGTFWRFGHDAIGRLTEADRMDSEGHLDWVRRYQYDAAGNRIGAGGTAGDQRINVNADDEATQTVANATATLYGRVEGVPGTNTVISLPGYGRQTTTDPDTGNWVIPFVPVADGSNVTQVFPTTLIS